jgi:hypothetical protein
MALSITKSQANYLKTVHLSEIGTGKDQPGVKLDAIEQGLIELAILFKTLAEKKIDVAQAINTGNLAESIQFEQVRYMGGVYSVDIKVLDYYKWVNKGVRGVKGGGSSPYKFKNLFVSKRMMQEIRKWLIREGLKVRTKPALKRPIGQEKKGRRFSQVDKTNAFAYAVARKIKLKGIKPTNFWDETEQEIKKQMSEAFGNYFSVAIINELTRK